MSRYNRKKPMKPSRARAHPGMKSVAGMAQVEAAREWVRSHQDLCPEIEDPKPSLSWTKDVPGYAEARSSSKEAAISNFAESELIRELAAAPIEEQLAIINRWRIRLECETPNQLIAELVLNERPERLVATLRDLSRELHNARRSRRPSEFFERVAHYPAIPVEGSRDLVGQLTTLIFLKTMPPMRIALQSLWTVRALWLAEIPDVAAFFQTMMKMVPELKPLTPPTEETLRGWVSKLSLFRYQGKGRVQFDQLGGVRADLVLRQEMSSTPSFLQAVEKGYQ